MRFAFKRVLAGRLAWVYLEERRKEKDANSSEPNWPAESAAQSQEATQAAWRRAAGFHCPGAGGNLSPPVP